MLSHRIAVTVVTTCLVCASAQIGFGQTTRTWLGEPGQPQIINNPGGFWGIGGQSMHFEQFMMMLNQLNMTPDFTLDKASKQKLQEIHEEWKTAQAKFLKENQEALQNLGKEQMEAFKGKEPEKTKAISEKYQAIYAAGPKSEEYVAKAKAALAPEQLKVVEEKLKKTEDERKAMMEKWQEHERKEGGEDRKEGSKAPGASGNPGKQP